MHTSKYEKNGSKVVQISPFWVGPNVHFTPAKNYGEEAEPFEEREAETAAAKCSVLWAMQWVFCFCALIAYICS